MAVESNNFVYTDYRNISKYYLYKKYIYIANLLFLVIN